MRLTSIGFALFLLAPGAIAEIEKTAVPCETGMCLFWWPKLAPIPGWHQDLEQSDNYGINALAPDGATFADAEVVMYARASFKPRMPEVTSLEMLMENDRKDFTANTPGVRIEEAKALHTADKKKLKSRTFLPTQGGNWERVAYGEEGEFYLVFTLSSRTKTAYEKAIPAYEALIRSYKEKP